MFENLSGYSNASYLVGNSPDELLEQIKAFSLPIEIINVYAYGSKHIAWFRATSASEVKRIKKTKEVK